MSRLIFTSETDPRVRKKDINILIGNGATGIKDINTPI